MDEMAEPDRYPEHLNVRVAENQYAFIQDHVGDDGFHNASQVVRAGIGLLMLINEGDGMLLQDDEARAVQRLSEALDKEPGTTVIEGMMALDLIREADADLMGMIEDKVRQKLEVTE